MTRTKPESPNKTCHKCGEQKPLAAFGRDARTADGLKTYCHSCLGAAIAAGHRRRRQERAAIEDRWVFRQPQELIAEMYSVLEAVLPFAQAEVECLADWVEVFPNVPDHAEDAELAQRGMEAIARAGRLIANKTSYIRQAQQALTGDPVTSAEPNAAGGTPPAQPSTQE